MLNLLDTILSKLPGNGWKTVLGYVLTYLPVIAPGLPVGEIDNIINQIGQLLLSIGILHKAIKELRKR